MGYGCGSATIIDNASSPAVKINENIPGNKMPYVTDAEKITTNGSNFV